MKRMSLTAAAAVALLTGAGAQAQSAYHWPAPESQGAPGMRYYVPMGTPVLLRTRTQISTKENRPGDRIYLEVAENVVFRGQIVIPTGSPVTAEVTRVQRNGHFGRKGKVEVRLISAETPNGPVRLNGTAYDEGKSGTAASVATMALVSILGGMLIHGTSGEIAPGTAVQGYLADDLKFTWHPQPGTATASYEPAVPDAVAARTPGFTSLK